MVHTSVFVLAPDFPPSKELSMLNGPVAASVEKARHLGYDGIELVTGDPDRFEAGVLEEALARHELKIAAINSGGIQYVLKLALVHADSAIERQAFQKLQSIICLAARLRCRVQVGVARGFAVEARPLREFRDRLVQTLRRACDFAGSLDVTLVVEYTCRFEINTLNTQEEASEVIQRVGQPNLGLLLDTHHSWVEDPDVYQAIRKAGPLLKHVHLHDSDYRSPGASHGELDFDQVAGALKEIGYHGFVSDGLFTAAMPEKEIRTSVRYLRDLMVRHGLRRPAAVAAT